MLYLVFFCLLGLAIGSFLNVVIYRLPLIERADETSTIQEWLKEKKVSIKDPKAIFSDRPEMTLSVPRSACPSCGHVLSILENIPILSYLFLKGRCRGCRQNISIRYPTIEALCAILFLIIFLKFGLTYQTVAAGLFAALLLGLSGIDYDHQILPDPLNYILLWSGLIASVFNLFVSTEDAIIGAVVGYTALWLLYQIHYRLTGRVGMGYGDFKLYAALGAWLGWQQLPLVALVAAIAGIAFFCGARARKNIEHRIPFGPFLAVGGFVCLIWGSNLTKSIQSFIW